MKKILLIILALIVLVACSDIVTDPPNSDELTSINKKPPKPDPEPTTLPVVISGDKHIIAGCFKLEGRKGIVSFRLWTDNNPVPQVREQPGDDISVAIYDLDGDAVDDLLVFVNYSTGKGKNEVRHYELQIWKNGVDPLVYELEGFDVKDIVIGELDGNTGNGDEIILVGNKEIRIFNPTVDDFYHPIKTISTGEFNVFGKSTTLGDADNDSDIDIVFASMNPTAIIICDYPSGSLSEISTDNELCDRIQVADVDNDNYNYNEIIWGGAFGYLHIVKYNINNSSYEDKRVSEDLGGYLFGIEVANFDEDEDLEIAVATAGGTPNIVAVYDLDNSTNFLVHPKTILSTSIESTVDMIAVNADSDAQMEIMLGTLNGGVLVYDYSAGYDTIFNESVDVTRVTSIYLK